MADATYSLGATPTVSVGRCSGDLEIEGRPEQTVVVESDSMPHSTQDDGRLVIDRCDEDLRLLVPVGATVSVDAVDGDVRAERLTSLRLSRVDGDVELRDIVGPCMVGDVEGDVAARDMADLSLGRVDGDVVVDRVTGRLELGKVGGDAALRGVLAELAPARIDGDLSMKMAFSPGREYRLEVGGDALVAVPAGADLEVAARVRGDVTGLSRTEQSGVYSGRWGDGSARLELVVGGDLTMGKLGAAVAGVVNSVIGAVRSAHGPDVGRGRFNERGAAPQMPHEGEATRPMDHQHSIPAPTPETEYASEMAVLEAVARGDLSPEEADRLLGRHSRSV